MRAKQENKRMKQNNTSSQYRIYSVKNHSIMKRQLLKIAVLVAVVASVAYLAGGSIFYWVVGFIVLRIILRVLISFFYTVVAITIFALTLFGILIS